MTWIYPPTQLTVTNESLKGLSTKNVVILVHSCSLYMRYGFFIVYLPTWIVNLYDKCRWRYIECLGVYMTVKPQTKTNGWLCEMYVNVAFLWSLSIQPWLECQGFHSETNPPNLTGDPYKVGVFSNRSLYGLMRPLLVGWKKKHCPHQDPTFKLFGNPWGRLF